MSERRDYHGSIVVGTDGSPTAQAAVDWAADRAAGRGHPLVIMSVLPDIPTISRTGIFEGLGTDSDPVTALDDARVRLEGRLDSDVARVRAAHPGLEVERLIVNGEASYPLAAATHTAELVVIGARGRSAPLRVRALGGTADAVVTHAHGPVVVIPQDAKYDANGPVVVGVDSSMESEEAIRLAVEEAGSRKVELVAVHTWDPMPWVSSVAAGWTVDERLLGAGLDAMVKDLIETHASAYPDLKVRRVVKSGHPAADLIEQSRAASLVAVGSRGRGGFAGLLLGSTSREVIRLATCPVLVTRAP